MLELETYVLDESEDDEEDVESVVEAGVVEEGLRVTDWLERVELEDDCDEVVAVEEGSTLGTSEELVVVLVVVDVKVELVEMMLEVVVGRGSREDDVASVEEDAADVVLEVVVVVSELCDVEKEDVETDVDNVLEETGGVYPHGSVDSRSLSTYRFNLERPPQD